MIPDVEPTTLNRGAAREATRGKFSFFDVVVLVLVSFFRDNMQVLGSKERSGEEPRPRP